MNILKKLCVLLLSISPVTVARDKLNYEITNIEIQNQYLVVEGWGLMPDTQHFKSSSTHEFTLKLSSKTEHFSIKGNLKNIDLTYQMSYRGYPTCSKNEYFKSNCNYDFKNVGFTFKVPLNDLKPNHRYKMHLIMHAKQTNKKYEIPVFYVQDKDLVLTDGRKEYTVFSDFRHVSFQVFAKTLVAREKASPLSNQIYLGNQCSKSYKNSAFIRHLAIFNKIYDIERYNDLITYFKVRVQPSGCVEQRQRLIESKTSSDFAYIPSNYANYLGNPAEIIVNFISTKPYIYADDVIIKQYSDYNPLDYASAYDSFDGNLTDKIKVISSNVNTSIPSQYQTCYWVSNNIGKSATTCAMVRVIKVPNKRRFVSRFTVQDTYLKWWRREELTSIFNKKSGLKSKQFNLD